jgi:DNA-binding transcriptional regulator YdaS (Cro superfamily)
MNFFNLQQKCLPLVGGVIQQQRLVVPTAVVARLEGYRHACRLAWKLRVQRRLTQSQLAALAGLYPSHVSDYFSVQERRRELPAKHVGAVERILGNTIISQWLARNAQVTLLEELQQAQREAA